MNLHVCAVCGKPLPLGGVLDDKQQRAHYLCAGQMKQRIADLAQATAKRMDGRTQRPRRPR